MYKRNKTMMNDDGVSLVEVIVAMSIIAFLIIAIFPFIMKTIERSDTNVSLAEATQLARAQMNNARISLTNQPCDETTITMIDSPSNKVTVNDITVDCPTGQGIGVVTVDIIKTGSNDTFYSMTANMYTGVEPAGLFDGMTIMTLHDTVNASYPGPLLNDFTGKYWLSTDGGETATEVLESEFPITLTAGIEYTFAIEGTFSSFKAVNYPIPNSGTNTYLRSVDQWNPELNNTLTNMQHAFSGSINFESVTTPPLENVTNMTETFAGASSFNQNLNDWDMSKVTHTVGMFKDATLFNNDNEPINWDTSNITDMNNMFNNAVNFNQNISNWDTNKVINMANMFNNASSFNQDLSNWNVSNVTSHAGFSNEWGGPNHYSPFYIDLTLKPNLELTSFEHYSPSTRYSARIELTFSTANNNHLKGKVKEYRVESFIDSSLPPPYLAETSKIVNGSDVYVELSIPGGFGQSFPLNGKIWYRLVVVYDDGTEDGVESPSSAVYRINGNHWDKDDVIFYP